MGQGGVGLETSRPEHLNRGIDRTLGGFGRMELGHRCLPGESLGVTVVVGGRGRISGQLGISLSIIAKMELFGFDQITALSEEAMNTVFASLYREARSKGHVDYGRIYEWSKTKLFSATFGGLTVHLLSGNKAVVCINIDKGAVHTKK